MAQFGGVAAGRLNVAQMVIATESAAARNGPWVTLAAPTGERDPLFPVRGREALLGDVMRLCTQGGGGRLHVLQGFGGSGKTSVVLEAVIRLEEQRAAPQQVWWLDARREPSLIAGITALARKVGLRPHELRSEDMADALWGRLSVLPFRWVLVLDSADEPSLLDGPGKLASGTGWLRPHSAPDGVVIVTTRRSAAGEWGGHAVLHAVGPLPVADAGDVLLDHTGPAGGTRREAEALGRRLGGLPLALRMAGSYLAEVIGMPEAFHDPDTPVNFAAYLRALERGGAPAGALQAVTETKRLSVELMERRGFPLAGRLLGMLAAFADAPIPPTLLLRPSALSCTQGLEGLDGPTLWRMLKEFTALGILDQLPAAEQPPQLLTVRLHPLIRDVSREAGGVGDAIALMACAVALAEIGLPEEPEAWPVWELLSPHALYLGRHVTADSGLEEEARLSGAETVELAARYLQALGLFGQACKEYETVLAVRRRYLGDEHPDTLSIRHNLASAHHDLGDLSRARAGYEAVWGLWTRAGGEDHLHALLARHELARVLHDLGLLEEAKAHHEQVLAQEQRLHGDEHPRTMASRHELARVLHDAGQLAAARSEYEAIFNARLRTLGAQHPRTLTAQHNLACVLDDLGQHGAAHSQFEIVLAGRSAVLGLKHPRTLNTQVRLARSLHAQGGIAQAGELMQAVWRMSGEVLGQDHPDTLRVSSFLHRWGLV
ncbi:tetratricopeptide repeat protein [Streptomyces sp. NPDC048305]|uniref:tetratricopeptide repeat protein n=1 Tax=Streptomyces sp. NPDC048305 TaxID=3365532 RepID=UPI003719E203